MSQGEPLNSIEILQVELDQVRANAQLLRQKLQIARVCLVQISNWEQHLLQDGNDPPPLKAAKVLFKLDKIDGE